MEHSGNVPAAIQSSPDKAVFLEKTQSEIPYFFLFSTKIAWFPSVTNKVCEHMCHALGHLAFSNTVLFFVCWKASLASQKGFGCLGAF